MKSSSTLIKVFFALSAFTFCQGNIYAGTLGPLTYTDTGTAITIDRCAVVPRGLVEVPATINGKPVDTIAAGAFANNTVTKVWLPDSVTRIGAGAFRSCADLTYIMLPQGLQEIEADTFRDCSSLGTLYLGGLGSLTTIGDGAFAGSGLRSLNITDVVTHLGTGIFEGCPDFSEFEFSQTATVVPERMFKDCPSLRNVFFSFQLKSIGKQAFYNSGIYFREIDDYDDEYRQFDLSTTPELTDIGEGAFQSCDNITFFKLPASVKNIGAKAFADCPNLVSMVFLGDAPVAESVDFSPNMPEFKFFVEPNAEGYSFPRWLGERIVVAQPEILVSTPKDSNLQNRAGAVRYSPTKVGSRSVRKWIYIGNIGNRPLTNFKLKTVGGAKKDFVIESKITTEVKPNSSIVIRVRFKPSRKGTRTTTLEIYSNDKNEKPFKLKLTGKGL